MTARHAGVLMLGGDWACAHGDAAGLAHVARMLEAHAPVARSRELRALARLCREDQALACERWFALRRAISDELASASA